MKISKLFIPGKTLISFEIFPPKPSFPLETIFATLDGLKELGPDFISVTYGAGGSSSARTIEIASKVKNDYGLETLAHLTCVGAQQAEITGLLERLRAANIENILALRGDPPAGETLFAPVGGGYAYAKDLIRHIKEKNGFCVAAAAYPEGHLECRDLDKDIRHLKQKVEHGADFLITQLFFDNSLFYSFLDRARNVGIDCPVCPGIMPVLNVSQINRIIALCGASVPQKLQRIMDKFGGTPDMEKAGIEYASEQITDLLSARVDGIHLYTMNKTQQTKEILRNTGLRK